MPSSTTRGLLSPNSSRGTAPLLETAVRALWDAGYEAAAHFQVRSADPADVQYLYVRALYTLRDQRIPATATEDNDPQFWEYVGAFGEGVRAYVARATTKPNGRAARAQGDPDAKLPGLPRWTKERDLHGTFSYELPLRTVRGLTEDPRFAQGEYLITPVFSGGSGRCRGYALTARNVGTAGRVEVEPARGDWHATPSAAAAAASSHFVTMCTKPNGRRTARARPARNAPPPPADVPMAFCDGCLRPDLSVHYRSGPDKYLCASCYRFWRDVIGPPPASQVEGPSDGPGYSDVSWNYRSKSNGHAAVASLRDRPASALTAPHAALAREVRALGYDNVPDGPPRLVPPTAFNLSATSAREVGLLGRRDTPDGPVVVLSVVVRALTAAAERSFAAQLVGRAVRYVLFFTADGHHWHAVALTADRTSAGLVPVLHRVPVMTGDDRHAVLDVLGWAATVDDDPMDALVASFDILAGVKPNPASAAFTVPPIARWAKTSRAGAYPLDASVFSYSVEVPGAARSGARFDLLPSFVRGRLVGWRLLAVRLDPRHVDVWYAVDAQGVGHTVAETEALLASPADAPRAAQNFLTWVGAQAATRTHARRLDAPTRSPRA